MLGTAELKTTLGNVTSWHFSALALDGPYSIRAGPPQLPPFPMLLTKIIFVGNTAVPIVFLVMESFNEMKGTGVAGCMMYGMLLQKRNSGDA